MTIVTIILLIIVIILCRIIKKKKRFIIDAQCPAADQLDLRMMTPRRTSYAAQKTDSDYEVPISTTNFDDSFDDSEDEFLYEAYERFRSYSKSKKFMSKLYSFAQLTPPRSYCNFFCTFVLQLE